MNVSNLAFYIGKSSNNNVVIYSYNINNGLLDTNNPLSSYWIMRENDNKIEELTFLEKSRAFGHEIIENPLNNDDIPFKIVSVDDIMNIRKAADNGVWQASAWFLERSFPGKWGKKNPDLISEDSDEPVEFLIKYADS